MRRDYIRSNLNLIEGTAKETVVPVAEDGNVGIALDGNPTTGYSWSYQLEPEGIVEEVGQDFYREYRDQDLVGSGGTFWFEFKGKEEGSTTLTFTYSRPWEAKKEDNQKRVFELSVDRNGNVTAVEK